MKDDSLKSCPQKDELSIAPDPTAIAITLCSCALLLSQFDLAKGATQSQRQFDFRRSNFDQDSQMRHTNAVGNGLASVSQRLQPQPLQHISLSRFKITRAGDWYPLPEYTFLSHNPEASHTVKC